MCLGPGAIGDGLSNSQSSVPGVSILCWAEAGGGRREVGRTQESPPRFWECLRALGVPFAGTLWGKGTSIRLESLPENRTCLSWRSHGRARQGSPSWAGCKARRPCFLRPRAGALADLHTSTPWLRQRSSTSPAIQLIWRHFGLLRVWFLSAACLCLRAHLAKTLRTMQPDQPH